MSTRDDTRKNEEDRQNKSADAIAALDAGEQGKPKKKKVKKKVVKEKTSTRNTSNDAINAGAERLMQPMRIKLRTAVQAGNKDLAAKLRARLVALQGTKI